MYQHQREARNASLRRIGRERAQRRTCPQCGRGNALRTEVDTTGCLGSVTTCRYCDYERGHDPVSST
jgi:transcription elongation factor Elf1